VLSILGRARGERRRRLPAGLAAGIGALVVAAGLAASAPAAHAATAGYLLFHNNLQGQLEWGGTGINIGPANSEEPGTSPAVAPVGSLLSPSGWDDAWVSSNGDVMVNKLFISTVDVGPAKHGTSPAIVTLTGGAYLVAFVDPNGDVVLVEEGDRQDFQFGAAAPGTSPALAALPNGQWEVGYQTTDGNLVTEGADNHGEWNLSLWPGTSPAMTGLANGSYEVAFSASGNAHLWTFGPTDHHGDWMRGMWAGTNPAIVGLPNGSYEVAFQANTSSLWTVGSDNHGNWGLGMTGGTSPAITLVGGGNNYEVAFEATNGNLWTAGWDNHGDWGSFIGFTSSPAIMPE
jgi:hypothetical protein